MGRQSNIKLKTTAGNIIFYKSKDDYYMRSKPQHIMQTEATQNCGNKFGFAARLEKIYRNLLAPAIPFSTDGSMQKRFRTAFYKWLLAKPSAANTVIINPVFITGFEFNTESLLAERLKVLLTIAALDEEKIVLDIASFQPQQSIAAPAYTKTVFITITAASCNLTDINKQINYSTELKIPFNNAILPQQQIVLPVPVLPGTLVLVALRLQYSRSKENGIETIDTTKRWTPAIVAATVYKG